MSVIVHFDFFSSKEIVNINTVINVIQLYRRVLNRQGLSHFLNYLTFQHFRIEEMAESNYTKRYQQVHYTFYSLTYSSKGVSMTPLKLLETAQRQSYIDRVLFACKVLSQLTIILREFPIIRCLLVYMLQS